MRCLIEKENTPRISMIHWKNSHYYITLNLTILTIFKFTKNDLPAGTRFCCFLFQWVKVSFASQWGFIVTFFMVLRSQSELCLDSADIIFFLQYFEASSGKSWRKLFYWSFMNLVYEWECDMVDAGYPLLRSKKSELNWVDGDDVVFYNAQL